MLDKKQIIAIASDHAGFELKNNILHSFDKNWRFNDLGTYNTDPVDYPDFAKLVVNEISSNRSLQGILICGTGIGMSIVANKHPLIRAALCTDIHMSKLARAHNNANILVLGAKIISVENAFNIVTTFLEANFDGGRHLRRIAKIL